MYGEELDYYYRLKIKGVKSYIVPRLIVFHPGVTSLINNPIIRYYRRRNALYFEKEFYNKVFLGNIYKRSWLISSMKFFIKLIINKKRDDLYYINIAILNALTNKKGPLKN